MMKPIKSIVPKQVALLFAALIPFYATLAFATSEGGENGRSDRSGPSSSHAHSADARGSTRGEMNRDNELGSSDARSGTPVEQIGHGEPLGFSKLDKQMGDHR